MKIVCIGDTHGMLPNPDKLPECDLIVIAGDICDTTTPHRKCVDYQMDWCERTLAPWLDCVPAKNIVAVAGNHDCVFQDRPQHFESVVMPKLNWHYLQDSGVEIDGLKIYGHPWCKNFCKWSFMGTQAEVAMHDGMIPDDTNILVTHNPPYGIMDSVQEVFHSWDGYDQDFKRYLGSKSLKRRVNELKDLKLHVFGHIHSAHGIQKPSELSEKLTTFVNAAAINEQYEPVYSVIELEI